MLYVIERLQSSVTCDFCLVCLSISEEYSDDGLASRGRRCAFLHAKVDSICQMGFCNDGMQAA